MADGAAAEQQGRSGDNVAEGGDHDKSAEAENQDKAAEDEIHDQLSKKQIGTGRRVGDLYVLESWHVPMESTSTALSSFRLDENPLLFIFGILD
ncbi:hypothetical protein RHGRI_007451 [Rhododendron griersonianum]|uniref:Uncharacterized protein n=1 Tax=Rhododendron griersonianum TaxID=479676 RepID=A0AAV6KWW9_9ERIC|nr:hypothetical protein RHGRI_007451 [Rhododendron griersonianum]